MLLEGHTASVCCCTWSTADGGARWIVSGSDDETLRVWDLAQGKNCFILEGHTGPVLCCKWSSALGGSKWILSGKLILSAFLSVYDCDICAQSTVQWKGESEETVKTRRNALRVIVQKLRNIWPVRRARAGPMPSSAQPWGASDTDAHLRMRTAHASASAFRVHTLAVLRI
jgi:WD40 repeat protein